MLPRALLHSDLRETTETMVNMTDHLSTHSVGDLTVGEEVELQITGIAHGGISVARHEGRVVFVSDAIPGETVMARITDAKKKKFARGTVTRVVEPSADRVDHVWAEAAVLRDPDERVGGAEFGHINLDRQRSLKQEVLQDSMLRFGKIEATAPVVAAPGDDERNGLGWRTRVRLHVDEETGLVGPYAERSRRVIAVESLPLANEQVNFSAPLGEFLPGVAAIDVIAPSGDDTRTLFLDAVSGERVGANDRVMELVGDRGFVVRAGGFWQVHREAPVTLFEAVRDTIIGLGDRFDPAAANLDLYGGVGILSAAMIEAGGPRVKVTSVESDSGATDDASENLSDFVGAMAVTGRVDWYLRDIIKNATAVSRERLRHSTVVLDPPRSGAGNFVTKALITIEAKNLVYVACDPVALARDTQTLIAAGYELTSLRAFDLFPHTHHFESIALFQRS